MAKLSKATPGEAKAEGKPLFSRTTCKQAAKIDKVVPTVPQQRGPRKRRTMQKEVMTAMSM